MEGLFGIHFCVDGAEVEPLFLFCGCGEGIALLWAGMGELDGRSILSP